MAKTAKKDPTAIARKFADGQIEALVGPEMEWSTDQGFEAVIQALIEQVPAHQQKHVLTLSQVVELQGRITAALPEDIQKEFSKLSEGECRTQRLHGSGLPRGAGDGRARGIEGRWMMMNTTHLDDAASEAIFRLAIAARMLRPGDFPRTEDHGYDIIVLGEMIESVAAGLDLALATEAEQAKKLLKEAGPR